MSNNLEFLSNPTSTENVHVANVAQEIFNELVDGGMSFTQARILVESVFVGGQKDGQTYANTMNGLKV